MKLNEENKNNLKGTKICPRCNHSIIGYPALSRKDNTTEICSNCGTLEALEDFIKYKENINEQ